MLITWLSRRIYSTPLKTEDIRSGVNLAGILGANPEGLVGTRGEVWGKGSPSHLQQKLFFHLKWRVLVHSEPCFLSVSLPDKNSSGDEIANVLVNDDIAHT